MQYKVEQIHISVAVGNHEVNAMEYVLNEHAKEGCASLPSPRV